MELKKQSRLEGQNLYTTVPRLVRIDTPISKHRSRALIKRIIDIAASFTALTLLSPLYLLIAAAIKLDSPGPVIFAQERVGLGNSTFTVYKFRSMHADSDERLHREFMARVIKDGQADNRYAGNGFYKMERDPRITRIGHILRKSSLDELPQFFNILQGDMSLVGPRPAIPYEAEMYEPWQYRRLVVKPGLTGLWQVSGRSKTTFEQMVCMDIDYIDNWSLMLDAKIIVKTVGVILTMRDAC